MEAKTLELIRSGNYAESLRAIENDSKLTLEEKIGMLQLFGGSAQAIEKLKGEFDVSTCEHKSTNGDNYGESCAVCGRQLRGYGYGGWFGSNFTGAERCFHEFVENGTGDRVCRFCEKTEVI